MYIFTVQNIMFGTFLIPLGVAAIFVSLSLGSPLKCPRKSVKELLCKEPVVFRGKLEAMDVKDGVDPGTKDTTFTLEVKEIFKLSNVGSLKVNDHVKMLQKDFDPFTNEHAPWIGETFLLHGFLTKDIGGINLHFDFDCTINYFPDLPDADKKVLRGPPPSCGNI